MVNLFPTLLAKMLRVRISLQSILSLIILNESYWFTLLTVPRSATHIRASLPDSFCSLNCAVHVQYFDLQNNFRCTNRWGIYSEKILRSWYSTKRGYSCLEERALHMVLQRKYCPPVCLDIPKKKSHIQLTKNLYHNMLSLSIIS